MTQHLLTPVPANPVLYRKERNLFLPRSPWTATADIITCMQLPLEWTTSFEDLPTQHAFNCLEEALLGWVVTFCCEYKTSNPIGAKRQITLDLCAAQHQRRALGFKDGAMYGATLVGRTFTIYVSTWRNDKVVSLLSSLDFFRILLGEDRESDRNGL